MICLFKADILANGGWPQLIGIIVVVAFYLIGGIAKALANRSGAGTDDDSKTSPAVEMAKKYLKQSRDKGQELMSEWDRQQQMRRQRFEQLHQREQMPHLRHVEPVKIRPAAVKPKLQPPVKVVRQPQQPQQRYSAIPQQIRYVQPTVQREMKPSIPVPQMVKVPPEPKRVHKKPAVTKVKTAHPFDGILKQPVDLRSAMILKEILDKPVAMREVF